MKVRYIDERGVERVAEDKDGTRVVAATDNAIVVEFAEPGVKKRAKVENGKVVFVEEWSSGIIEIPVLKIIEKI